MLPMLVLIRQEFLTFAQIVVFVDMCTASLAIIYLLDRKSSSYRLLDYYRNGVLLTPITALNSEFFFIY